MYDTINAENCVEELGGNLVSLEISAAFQMWLKLASGLKNCSREKVDTEGSKRDFKKKKKKSADFFFLSALKIVFQLLHCKSTPKCKACLNKVAFSK